MPNLFQIEIESFKPSVDMYETKSGMHIDIELPGISQEQVELATDNQNLVVKGNKKQAKLGDRYHRLERSFGFFYRNIKLPERYQNKPFQSKWSSGLLQIFIPR